MDDFVIRLIFLGIGLIIGWMAGTMRTTLKYARAAQREAKAARDAVAGIKSVRMKGDDGVLRMEFVWWSVITILIAISVFGTAKTNVELAQTQQQFVLQQQCTEKFLSQTVQALNERTTFSSKIATADREQNEALAALIGASLKQPQPDEQEARSIVKNYGDKLNRYLDLIERDSKNREQHPYPTASDYRTCIEDAE